MEQEWRTLGGRQIAEIVGEVETTLINEIAAGNEI